MKRLRGFSLFLLLVLLSGCFGGKSVIYNRVTLSGTIYKTASEPFAAGDFNGGTMEITVLTPGADGLKKITDVDDATVSENGGTFTLHSIPTDRRVVLKIKYIKSGQTQFYTWYVLDPNNPKLDIRPQDWAASRLAFDLVRSFVDHKWDRQVYGSDYDQILEVIKPWCASADMASWISSPSAFAAYLSDVATTKGIIQACGGYLSPILESACGKTILQKVEGEPSWSSDYYLITEFPGVYGDNPDLNLVSSSKIDFIKVSACYQPESRKVRVRIAVAKNSTVSATTDMAIAVWNPDDLGSGPEVFSLDSTSSQASDESYNYYEIQIPETSFSSTSYRLIQAIQDSANLWPGVYDSIDKDRTPCAYVQLPA